jgi:hypothetical protein
VNRSMRVKLVPTKRSDVMCVRCLGFQADHVILLTNGTEADTGVHKKCVDEIAAKFTRNKRSAAAE